MVSVYMSVIVQLERTSLVYFYMDHMKLIEIEDHQLVIEFVMVDEIVAILLAAVQLVYVDMIQLHHSQMKHVMLYKLEKDQRTLIHPNNQRHPYTRINCVLPVDFLIYHYYRCNVNYELKLNDKQV